MKDLGFYLLFSEKLINSFSKKYKLSIDISEDFISYVAHRIMKGDMGFDMDKVSAKSKLNKTKEECHKHYLRQCGIFGIKAYMTNMKKKKKSVRFSEILPSNKGIDSYLNLTVSESPLERLCDKEDKAEIVSLVNLLVHSSGLTTNEAHIIKRHFYDGKSFADIARENRVAPQAINLSYQNALNKMSDMVKQV
jgi:hypothetical protein